LAIDLFSGAGGLSQGLRLAGFDVILAADIDAAAVQTHRAHFPGASIQADLSDPKVVEEICSALKGISLDLVAGGPPCQPYSQAAYSKVRHLVATAGKAPDSRRKLWSPFLEVVRRTKPRAVLIENVPDVAFGRDGHVFREVVNELEQLGYYVDSAILSSQRFGVPQHRQRLFVAAFREPTTFAWPKGKESDRRTLRDAISDLPKIVAGVKTSSNRYSGISDAKQSYYRTGVRKSDTNIIYDHFTRAVRPDDLEAFKLMNSKTKYSDLPERLKRYRDDIFHDKYKRLDWDEPSRTITAHIAKDGYWYIHPEQHRTLSIREAARIQTFPDRFRFCGYPRDAFKQIGEAVPPLLAKAVGGAILRSLERRSEQAPVSTTNVSRTLVEWLHEQGTEDMRNPWLLEKSFWVRALGYLISRQSNASGKSRLTYKELAKHWRTARAYAKDRFRRKHLNRYKLDVLCARLDQLAPVITGWRQHGIEQFVNAGLSPTSAGVLLATAGKSFVRPANQPMARLARRFWDRGVTEDDGRGTDEMLLGRLVGTDCDGHAYCALVEIAARYCTAGDPRCDSCPLREHCLRRARVHGER